MEFCVGVVRLPVFLVDVADSTNFAAQFLSCVAHEFTPRGLQHEYRYRLPLVRRQILSSFGSCCRLVVEGRQGSDSCAPWPGCLASCRTARGAGIS
ncbi:unnamed protein product [Pylaiella littoralis]